MPRNLTLLPEVRFSFAGKVPLQFVILAFSLCITTGVCAWDPPGKDPDWPPKPTEDLPGDPVPGPIDRDVLWLLIPMSGLGYYLLSSKKNSIPRAGLRRNQFR